MSTLTIPKSEVVIQSSSRRYPLTYARALQLALTLVVAEANQRDSDLSEDEIELRAAKRAAALMRNSY